MTHARPHMPERHRKGYSIVVHSAEATRMTGMNRLPQEKREPAIRAFLDSAWSDDWIGRLLRVLRIGGQRR